MNNQRRGIRSRRGANSETPNRTLPPIDDSQNDDEFAQDSDADQDADDENQNTNDDASSDDEHPDDDSSSNQYGHSPEERSAWENLKAKLDKAEKGKQHADRKITEQGQTNAELSARVKELEGEIQQKNTQLATFLTGDQSQDDSPYDNVLGMEGQEGDKDVLKDMALLKGVLGKYIKDQKEMKSLLVGMHENSAYENDVTDIQDRLGVDREAAEVMVECFDQGRIGDFAEALELTSLPKEARNRTRTERERRRTAASVGHPGSQSPNYMPDDTSDDASREKRARQIHSIKDKTERRKAISDALDDDPAMFGYIAGTLDVNI